MNNSFSYDREIDDAGVSTAWASVRIYSGVLSAKEISDRLGLAASEVVVKGERPRPNSPPAEFHAWFLSSQDVVPIRDARAHLDEVLDPLMRVKDELADILKIEGVKASFQLYWWAQEGSSPVFWPEQMSKLAELGLEFTIQFVQVEPGDKRVSFDA